MAQITLFVFIGESLKMLGFTFPACVKPSVRFWMAMSWAVMFTSGYLAIGEGVAIANDDLAQLESNAEEEEEEVIRINVTGEILDQPISSPTRGESTLRDVTRPAYVIRREQLQQQGARTVREGLRFIPGVLGDGTVGTDVNSLSGQFIRGSNTSQVLILLDGRPVNALGSGGFDLSEISTDNVERIEVLPGGGSALYGSDAIGGIINIVTRQPSATPEGSASAKFGSYNFNEQNLQFSGTAEKLGYFLSYNRIQSDGNYPFELGGFSGKRENNDTKYDNLTARLTYPLSDRTQLSFSAIYLPKEQGVPGGIPIANPVFGQGFFNSLTDDNRKYTDQFFSDLSIQSKLGGGDDSTVTTRFYADWLNTRFDSRTAFADTLSVGPDGVPILSRRPQSLSRFETRQRSLGVQVQHNWQFSDNQGVVYGFDYRNTQVKNQRQNLVTEAITPGYDDTVSQGALFAQYTASPVQPWTLVAGVRQEFSSLSNGSAFSPTLGTKLKLGESTTLRANYIRNFRLPTLTNLFSPSPTNIGNPDLKPERGNSFDVGIDQSFGDFALLRLTYFNNTISDLLAFKRISPPVDGISGTYQNLGKVRTQGLEAALNLRLADNVFASLGYTLNSPKILESSNPGETDKELRFAGADKLNLGLWYERPSGWYVGLLMNSLSSYPTNNTNTEFLPGYTTFDLRTQIPISEQLRVSLGVQNLLDQRFQLFSGFPDNGRTFEGGLSYRF